MKHDYSWNVCIYDSRAHQVHPLLRRGYRSANFSSLPSMQSHFSKTVGFQCLMQQVHLQPCLSSPLRNVGTVLWSAKMWDWSSYEKSFGWSVPQSSLVPHTLAQHEGGEREDFRRKKSQQCHHSMTPAQSLQAQRIHIAPPTTMPQLLCITDFHIINCRHYLP